MYSRCQIESRSGLTDLLLCHPFSTWTSSNVSSAIWCFSPDFDFLLISKHLSVTCDCWTKTTVTLYLKFIRNMYSVGCWYFLLNWKYDWLDNAVKAKVWRFVYSASSWEPHPRCDQVGLYGSHSFFYIANTPNLPLPRKRSPGGATTG